MSDDQKKIQILQLEVESLKTKFEFLNQYKRMSISARVAVSKARYGFHIESLLEQFKNRLDNAVNAQALSIIFEVQTGLDGNEQYEVVNTLIDELTARGFLVLRDSIRPDRRLNIYLEQKK